MPWLSPSASPAAALASPRSSNRYSVLTFGHAPSPSVTYIPQLIDGACGTMAHSQQRSIPQRLRGDLSTAARLLPALARAALAARATAGLADAAQHVALALLELAMLVAVVPLWLLCPGLVFLAWLGGCAALVVGASWSLNGGRAAAANASIVRSPSPAVDDERWFFVGGMGMR